MRRCLLACFIGASWVLDVPAGAPAQTADSPARAVVWQPDFPGADPALAVTLARQAQTAGYHVDYLDTVALTNVTRLAASRARLLILPGARTLPTDAVASIQSYLRDGGNLLAAGLPAWETPLCHRQGRWLTRVEYEGVLGAQRPRRLLFDFSRAGLEVWTRQSSHPQSVVKREVVEENGASALHVVLDKFQGWDTLASPRLTNAFAPGDSLTCFRARGGPRTHQLALEWIEEDGSRWIATVDLGSDWKQYGLTPEAFRPWMPPPGRGGPRDRLDLRKAIRFTVGLAFSHTSIEAGRHEYWIQDLGTAPNPLGDDPWPDRFEIPRWESLCPGYQLFPITTAARVRSRSPFASQVRAGALGGAGPIGKGWLAFHPRPRGVGLDQDRPWRWEPLLAAYDTDTEDYRGAVGALVVHLKPPFRSGVWALFSPADAAFYQDPMVQGAISNVLTRMRRGVFLAEGGSEFFTVFAEQTPRMGARVINTGQEAASQLRVRLSVLSGAQQPPLVLQEWPLSVGGGQMVKVDRSWQPPEWPLGGWRVRVELWEEANRLDWIEHSLDCWQPKPAPSYLEVRDGRLWLEGRPWKAHGVNYMPSSGIGVGGDYFEFWLGRGAYDPEVIQRDLERVAHLGLNAVSVFVYHQSLSSQHLLDFLRRCERLGLRVNQSLRPGTPMEFRWPQMKALIEFYRLAQNDTVLAYDLAWEPSHYDHNYQKSRYTAGWASWVQRRYGTLAAAKDAWGEGIPSGDLAPTMLTVPTMRELTRDGVWRRRVADYRLFLDDLLHEKYAEARRLVRTVDAHHLVSFRMQHAGDPTHNSEDMLPYDFYGLSEAVDLWEPEAYGRIGDWNQIKPGCFTAAYARLCDPTKPVLWAEMGFSTWDVGRMSPDERKLQTAAGFYRDFYRMLTESGSDGVFFWWYPGGFRLNENSDFGIINPDGTDRPVTRVIRTEGQRFLAAPRPPVPTRWIAVDRERDARGLFGIYETVKSNYWRSLENGVGVGLKWERRPGNREPRDPSETRPTQGATAR